MDRVRVDKWLWAARFAKTRSAATDLALAGHVKIGGERVKPAREVAPGDTLEIQLGAIRRVVVVTGLADRRGPAKVAASLYEETPESREERERLSLERQKRERQRREELGQLVVGDDDHLARPPDRSRCERGEAPSGGADARVPLGADRRERTPERGLEAAVEPLDSPRLEVRDTE